MSIYMKIGTELYRWITAAGLFQYKVVGTRQYADDIQYEVECQTCSHGWKCLLLIAEDDYKKLQYVKMLNDDEDDSQRHFHTHSGEFFLSKSDALIGYYKKTLIWYKDEINKFKSQIKSYEEKEKEIQNLISIQEAIKNEN